MNWIIVTAPNPEAACLVPKAADLPGAACAQVVRAQECEVSTGPAPDPNIAPEEGGGGGDEEVCAAQKGVRMSRGVGGCKGRHG